MSDEIEVGDVVQLKSGGPNMTVSKIGHADMSQVGPVHAWCAWFDSKGDEKRGNFPLTSLVKK